MLANKGIAGGGSPFWLWIALAYFAYDDIFRFMMTPILFYPLMFVFSILALLYSFGLGPIIIPIIRTNVNFAMRLAGVPSSFHL